MRKIPTVFKRDPDDMRRVLDEVTPGCEWVLAGDGVPTRKYDGTCVMLDENGMWWARREVKPGKTPPPGWVEADRDDTTGKRPGWEPIAQSPWRKVFKEVVAQRRIDHGAGTYELCGPKINGNPERFTFHQVVKHELAETAPWFPDIRGLMEFCRAEGWEGIVWHHHDGRMAKLKVRDYPEPTA